MTELTILATDIQRPTGKYSGGEGRRYHVEGSSWKVCLWWSSYVIPAVVEPRVMRCPKVATEDPVELYEWDLAAAHGLEGIVVPGTGRMLDSVGRLRVAPGYVLAAILVPALVEVFTPRQEVHISFTDAVGLTVPYEWTDEQIGLMAQQIMHELHVKRRGV